MKIETDTAVTVRFRVTDAQGKLLQGSADPMAYLHGGYGNTLPAIEAALDGHEAGYQTTLELAPADAFGERDETLVRTIPRSEFPPGVKVGGELEGRLEDGRAHVFTVMKIKGPQVLLDGNHPWAGKTLRFALHVTEVRAATAEEITHRHVHGAHGHHH
jgi:FKBP-type peptidyl-prolyl cis-trans isomerase SlyD